MIFKAVQIRIPTLKKDSLNIVFSNNRRNGERQPFENGV